MISIKYEPISRKLFKNQLFGFVVKLLLIGGYIVIETQTFKLWHFCRSAILSLSFVFGCIFGITFLAINGIYQLCFATTCALVATAIAYMNFFFRRRRLGRILNFLQEDMEKLMINADEREEQMFKETCKFMLNVQLAAYIPTIIGAGILFTDSFYRTVFDQESIFNYAIDLSILDSQSLLAQTLPYRALHDDFYLGFVFPIFLIFIEMTYIPLWPVFLTNLMSYVNVKWKIMQKRMSEMDISKVILEPYEVELYSSLVEEDDRINFLRTRLCKLCINEQVRNRWLVDQLQELIHIPVFTDSTIYSIIMCFVLHEITSGKQSSMGTFLMLMCEVLVIVILFLYHWNGTLVSESSYAMGFAIYSSDWYNYSLDVQKMILLIMIITADPVEMKAFFIRLHVTTFIDIIRAAYSYFNILRSSS